MLKSAKLWMITDSSLNKASVTECPPYEALAETCSHVWTVLDGLVLREKHWTLEQVSGFWQTLSDKTSRIGKASDKQPLRLLNWPMTYAPWFLPIDGLHLDGKVAQVLKDSPEDYRDFQRRIKEKHWQLGLSIHSLEEWLDRRVFEPDYVLLSNIYETTCKPGKSGLGKVDAAILTARIRQDSPNIVIIGLGGLRRSDAPDMVAIGLNGIALRTEFHMD